MGSDKTDFGFQSVSFNEKTQRVQSVFKSVALQYDLMNDVMSGGLHRLWKHTALQKAHLQPGQTVLDCAGGTGDLSFAISKQIGPKGTVVLADLNAQMLSVAKERALNKGILKPLSFCQSNAQALPFMENCFDRIFIAFGLRNVTEKQTALQEFYRLLKPGGKCLILEFSKPKGKFLEKVYNTYSFNLIPKFGKWLANDEASYQYLVESIRMHPDQSTLQSMMETAGFSGCSHLNLTGGIVALHTGYK